MLDKLYYKNKIYRAKRGVYWLLNNIKSIFFIDCLPIYTIKLVDLLINSIISNAANKKNL